MKETYFVRKDHPNLWKTTTFNSEFIKASISIIISIFLGEPALAITPLVFVLHLWYKLHRFFLYVRCPYCNPTNNISAQNNNNNKNNNTIIILGRYLWCCHHGLEPLQKFI